MTKELKSQVRYKTFTPSFDGFIVTGEKKLGQKLVTIFETKDKSNTIDKSVRFIGTTESVDRDNEVIKLEGWDFANYVKNPIVLWGHEHRSLPIGKTVGIYKDEVRKAIYFDIEFTESHELAKSVKALVDEGILKATSVGFKVLDWDYDESVGGFVFTKTELFEISIVNVPANQDAIVQEGKSEEDSQKKSAEIDNLTTIVTQMQAQLAELAAREVPAPTPVVEPVPPVVEEVPAVVVDPVVVEEVTPELTPTLDGTMVEQIVTAVLERINQSNQDDVPPVVDAPGAETVVDALGSNTEPEPKVPEAEEQDVVVSIGDLDESTQFIIITEEDN